MDIQSIAFIFNRALSLTFSAKKLLLVFCCLALSGLLVIFFRGIAWHAGQWVQLSLTFLPVFLCAGILLSLGILLIRIYYHEVKKREISYKEIFKNSWELIIGASYFAIPIILTYLLLWMLLGFFVLLKEIPAVGDFFGAILAFAPFLVNLGTLILCLFSLALLFFVAPAIALNGINYATVFHVVIKRLEKDPFFNMLLILIALIPLLLVVMLLTMAAIITGSMCLTCHSLSQTIIRWFFVMLPFTAFLTPAVIFFFNFAAEAYALMHKYLRQ